MRQSHHLRQAARHGSPGAGRALAPAFFMLFGALPALGVATALAADPAEIEEGMRVYKTTGACESCHGWLGQNYERHDGASWVKTAPSLIRTGLDRAQMIELVACGTPGGEMPRYLAQAWTDERRCYGKVAADLPPAERPPHPYSTLGLAKIEAVVTFVQEVYQGKGMTLPYCIKYFGPTSHSCDLLR